MGPGFPSPRFLRRAACCFGALVLGCVITQFSQAATADELTDALIRYAMHDYPRAVEMLTPLADRGDAVAQTKLGLIYTRGEGVARDDVAALGWLTRAAEQDQSEAQFELGVMYRDGLGTPANGALAMHWFERATERGVPHAFNAIGEMYLGHQDVAQDYAAALSWLLRGAQLDNAESLYNIGVRYALGQGVERDETEAYKWFDLAADAGIGELRSKAVRARQAIGEGLMPLQVSRAKIGARDWLSIHGSASTSPEDLSAKDQTHARHRAHASPADRMSIRPARGKTEINSR
jgi:TPR repeat protein